MGKKKHDDTGEEFPVFGTLLGNFNCRPVLVYFYGSPASTEYAELKGSQNFCWWLVINS